ncbi:MAG: hypothetical protein KDD40_04230 [Bdellovibrionales bacterium]|nr:hypothetical protein [Bdellovibrionales bacterium]
MFTNIIKALVVANLGASLCYADQAITNILGDKGLSQLLSTEITSTQLQNRDDSRDSRERRHRKRSSACEISFPGERDLNQRYCDNSYGVLYDGVIANNTCYYTLDRAIEEMKNLNVCSYEAPYSLGRCELIKKNEKDSSGRYCDNTYGFTYRGYIVNNTCYNSIQRAAEVMEATSVCYKRSRRGNCELAMPNQRDNNQRYCENSYGVLYKGYIANNTCYHDINSAMTVMYDANYCY